MTSVLVPIGISIVLAVLLAVAGALECERLVKRHPDLLLENALARAPDLWVLIPLSLLLLLSNVAAVVVRMKRPAFYWEFPLWLEYWLLPIAWGLIAGLFAFTFGLASALALRTAHRERRKVVLAAMLIVAVIPIMQWNYSRPVPLKDEISPAGLVSQTSPVSCAAASGATILRTFGLPRTEREVASLNGTSLLGASAAQVIYGNERLGIASRKVDMPDRDPARLAAPAMIFVDHHRTCGLRCDHAQLRDAVAHLPATIGRIRNRTETCAEACCCISSYLQTMASKGDNSLVAIQLTLSGQIPHRPRSG